MSLMSWQSPHAASPLLLPQALEQPDQAACKSGPPPRPWSGRAGPDHLTAQACRHLQDLPSTRPHPCPPKWRQLLTGPPTPARQPEPGQRQCGHPCPHCGPHPEHPHHCAPGRGCHYRCLALPRLSLRLLQSAGRTGAAGLGAMTWLLSVGWVRCGGATSTGTARGPCMLDLQTRAIWWPAAVRSQSQPSQLGAWCRNLTCPAAVPCL